MQLVRVLRRLFNKFTAGQRWIAWLYFVKAYY